MESPLSGKVCVCVSFFFYLSWTFACINIYRDSWYFSKLYFLLTEKYEKDAKKYWDVFYKRHQDKVSLPNFFYSLRRIAYLGITPVC